MGKSPHRNHNVVWTDRMEADLRKLWDEKLPARKIATKMKISHNAIFAKANRLKLPTRLSPDTLKKYRENRAENRLKGRTKEMGRERQKALNSAVAARVFDTPFVPPPYSSMPERPDRSIPCSYPIGQPRTESFHYCNAATIPGGVYCQEHYEICVTGKGTPPNPYT